MKFLVKLLPQTGNSLWSGSAAKRRAQAAEILAMRRLPRTDPQYQSADPSSDG
jgi:hypothetical protein